MKPQPSNTPNRPSKPGQSAGSLQRLVRRHWRHTAWLAVCLMLLSIIGGAWNVRITQWGMALAQIWIMTVPCGIAVINKNKMLWILRQLCFGGSAAANIVAALK